MTTSPEHNRNGSYADPNRTNDPVYADGSEQASQHPSTAPEGASLEELDYTTDENSDVRDDAAGVPAEQAQQQGRNSSK